MKATIENTGAIRKLALEIPEHGGVVELLGLNGSGKSTALDAISTVLAGKGSVPVRDGERAAVVDFGGITLKCSKSTRRLGELEVTGLSGKLDVGDLVDGNGIDDPVKADVWRIRALIGLKGLEANPAEFYSLLGGKEAYEKLVPPGEPADDPVDLAGRVKRACHAEALKVEGQAKHERGHEASLKENAGKVDLHAQCDADVLQQDFVTAIGRESQLKERQRAHWKQSDARKEAEAKLAEFTANNTLPTVAVAADNQKTAVELYDQAVTREKELTLHLERAKAEVLNRHAALLASVKELEAAKQHDNAIAGWRETLATTVTEMPPVELLDEAADAVERARQAIERGALVRKAKEDRAAAERHADKALELEKRAAQLRDAAHGTDDVLNRLVKSPRFRIEAIDGVPRLVVEHARGKSTPYSELSPGERWPLALSEAAEILKAAEADGKHPILVAGQEAWEGLDELNRLEVVAQCRAKGVVLITARASAEEDEDGNVKPLRAHVYGE